MERPVIAFPALLVAVALAGITLPARQQNAHKPPAPPKLGMVEMQRLKFYLGEWDYVEQYPKSAMYPEGGKNTGLYTSKLGPGGNSLVNTFHSQGPMGEFAGLLVMTWDTKEKVYREYVFGSDFPGAMVETGAFEGDALAYRFEFPPGGPAVKLRNVTRVITADKLESDQYSSINGAPEKLVVHVTATRRH